MLSYCGLTCIFLITNNFEQDSLYFSPFGFHLLKIAYVYVSCAHFSHEHFLLVADLQVFLHLLETKNENNLLSVFDIVTIFYPILYLLLSP